MVYVVALACLWAAVGALVFFGRADIGLPQRAWLTVGASVVFGFIGYIDVSSIYQTVRTNPAAVAKQLATPYSSHRSVPN